MPSQFSILKSDASNRPKIHLVCVIILSLLTIRLLFVSYAVNVCRELDIAHKHLLRDLEILRNTKSKLAHTVLRTTAAEFLTIAQLKQARSCRHLQPNRQQLEFTVADSPLDGVLLYILSVVGARKKVIAHVDSSRQASGIGSYLVRHHSWTLVTVCEKWSGFEATRKYFEHDSEAAILDTGHLNGNLKDHLGKQNVAGIIDALVMFPEHGADIPIMVQLNEELRPRVLVMFYQDYWSTASRSRVGRGDMDANGREVLFTGASLTALVIIGRRIGYRLVWCLKQAPIALFVDEKALVAEGLLKTKQVQECFRYNELWRRDAEAKWDEAQKYKWERLS